ncbi:hypothetical protein T492DRAFT_931371 [Pavlovales sp. CCMP2436]|nr:hypothetical protein T492DRAFT_931371 [Pavlovales sp. CCMP2436]
MTSKTTCSRSRPESPSRGSASPARPGPPGKGGLSVPSEPRIWLRPPRGHPTGGMAVTTHVEVAATRRQATTRKPEPWLGIPRPSLAHQGRAGSAALPNREYGCDHLENTQPGHGCDHVEVTATHRQGPTQREKQEYPHPTDAAELKEHTQPSPPAAVQDTPAGTCEQPRLRHPALTREHHYAN